MTDEEFNSNIKMNVVEGLSKRLSVAAKETKQIKIFFGKVSELSRNQKYL